MYDIWNFERKKLFFTNTVFLYKGRYDSYDFSLETDFLCQIIEKFFVWNIF